MKKTTSLQYSLSSLFFSEHDSQDLNIRNFLKEAYVMKHFHHENVLELLGVCMEDNSDPLVLLPFMPHGDLLKYLHDDNNVCII